MNARAQELLARIKAYGRLGFAVYVCIALATVAVLAVLLEFGVAQRVPWIAERAPAGSTVVVAYGLYKALMIPRAALTLALTPLIARLLNRGKPS